MKFFNFFTRSDTLCKVLTAIDIVGGAILWIAFFFGLRSDDFRHDDRLLMLFVAGILFWMLLVVITVVLRVLVKDAREDLAALLRLSEQTKETQ